MEPQNRVPAVIRVQVEVLSMVRVAVHPVRMAHRVQVNRVQRTVILDMAHHRQMDGASLSYVCGDWKRRASMSILLKRCQMNAN